MSDFKLGCLLVTQTSEASPCALKLCCCTEFVHMTIPETVFPLILFNMRHDSCWHLHNYHNIVADV
jgi:hypothetical protein